MFKESTRFGRLSTPHTRHSERVPFRAAVSLVTETGRHFFGWSRDISTGGVRMVTDERPPLADLCQVHITVGPKGGKHTLRVQGQVCHCDSTSIGIRFFAVDDAAHAELTALVETALRDRHVQGRQAFLGETAHRG